MEEMALESLVASKWRLEGFLTITRHPVRIPQSYTDFDVIGVKADGTVRVAECKARGRARAVNIGTENNYWRPTGAYVKNLPLLWRDEDSPYWLPALKKVKKLEFSLVGNVWFKDQYARESAERRLAKDLWRNFNRSEKAHLRRKPIAHVTPSVEILMNIIGILREDIIECEWGKRYGDPLLDSLRELIRYAHPKPSGGGRIANNISSAIHADLMAAVFGKKSLDSN